MLRTCSLGPIAMLAATAPAHALCVASGYDLSLIEPPALPEPIERPAADPLLEEDK